MAQRLRYFDGEFLRGGDFTDEQSYHITMRRLLTHEVHGHGIVRGLHLVQDQNSVPNTPAQFWSVATGFAIDQIGREIAVSAPTSLTPLLSRAGLQPGLCELWIVYTETPATPAAPGYQLCDQPSQDTRWTESFNLILRQLGAPPDPNTPNPNLDLKGICLGLVRLNYDPVNGWYFSVPPDWYRRRSYARIHAQQIIAPDDVDQDTFNFFGPAPSAQNTPPPPASAPDGYIHIRTQNGVVSDGNLLVGNNMLVGEDFVLDNTTPTGTNLPSPPLPTPGNVKIAGDLFVQGDLYGQISGNWTKITDYINQLVGAVADIQLSAAVTIPISGGVGPFPVGPAVTVTVTTAVTQYASVSVQAYIVGTKYVDQGKLHAWTTAAGPPQASIFNLTAIAVPASGPGGTVTITVGCSVAGDPSGVGTSIFESVDVACVAIFRPT